MYQALGLEVRQNIPGVIFGKMDIAAKDIEADMILSDRAPVTKVVAAV
jgi:hypothetical protein